MRTSALFSFVQTPSSLVMMRLLSALKWSFARLPTDPLSDETRAVLEFDTFTLARSENPHDRPVDERRLGQVEHDPRAIPPDFRLNRDQVSLVDLPADPQ